MNPRRALTAALLGFVLVSLGYLALRSVRAAKQWSSSAVVTETAAPVTRPVEPAAAPAAPAVSQSAPAASAELRPVAQQTGKIIAYYFHVTVRCTTCRAIESYSKEVIHSRFSKELASGQMEWRLVNVQLPENRHYVQDYQLFTKSLVLVHMQGGQQKEFKVLNDTWELVGNKAAMQGYVEKEVRDYLRKIG
ncbi:MAG TPA: nitrophenyl compound nitroreductase subunit ArsF family protein [Bryobacteraceae bacterium]|nr:nitrophenyl compound nitroreductase subunit ArsF family protein [Bryobacteraceae bacterium]HPT26092.1 nitrophenyl compound nitroreductase subunit ArsF family protein [Bryobacteraceae bacterium]